MATSPFKNVSAGANNIQSVADFRANNPALWGNLYSDIQTGQMQIGERIPGQGMYDESGNLLNKDPDTYRILDAEGNPTQWRAEPVGDNTYKVTLPNRDYIQTMFVGADPKTGYVAPIQDTSKQIGVNRWNYSGSGLQSILQNPVSGLMLSTLLPGAGSAIGSALGLGEGALASAAGSSLLGGATSSLAGGDFTKGALAGGLGSLAGSALNAGNASPADIAAMADVGMGTNTSLLQSAAQAAGQAAGQAAAQPTGIETLPEATVTPVPSPTELTAAPIPEPTGIEALTEPTVTPVPDQTVLTPTPIPEPTGIQALTTGQEVVTPAPEPKGIETLPASPSDYLAADAAQTQTNLQDPFAYTEPGAVETIPSAPSTPSTPTTDTDYSDYGSPTGPGAPGTSITSVPTEGGGAELIDTTGVPVVDTGAAATSPGWLQQLSDATGLPIGLLQGAAGALGIKALGSLLPDQQPGTPQQGSQTPVGVGLSSSYTPYTYKPYAGGGAVEHMSNANAIGANTGFPMANIQRGAYATPYQQPISQNVVTGPQDTRVDPYTGEELLAGGGIASLGAYSDGGRMLRGPGDGVSDSIPAVIGNGQPARLADGEFVIPARLVSELGNGSTEAGARQLYAMMDRIQAARRKSIGKGKVAVDSKAAKHLPA